MDANAFVAAEAEDDTDAMGVDWNTFEDDGEGLSKDPENLNDEEDGAVVDALSVEEAAPVGVNVNCEPKSVPNPEAPPNLGFW